MLLNTAHHGHEREEKYMELQQLKYFKTVAETGKVVTAAESLYISPPALSTSISRLEKELGMQLFDRVNNRITLNKQGKIFLRYVNQALNCLDVAKVELRQSLLQQGQHVSIAVTNSSLWVDLITAFSQEYSQFTLACTTLKMTQLSRNGLQPQYSFLLAEEGDISAEHADCLDSILLFENQPAIMVHPDNPLADKAEVDIHMLQGEKLLLPMHDHSLYERIDKLFEENGLSLPSTHSYSHLVCRSMVAENLGVSLTTMHTDRIRSSGLRCIPVSNRHRPWLVRMYWHKNKDFSEDELIFKEFIEEFYHANTRETSGDI